MGRTKSNKRSASNFVWSRVSRRKDQDRILIVTEGEKSETSYFSRLAIELELSGVQIIRSKGTAPTNVVKTAIRGASRLDVYNEIYCLFDQDTNDKSYAEAFEILRRAARTEDRRQFIAIPSLPCFELWYLLHVEFSDRSYRDGVSPCERLIKALRKHKLFQNYQKTSCEKFYEQIAGMRDEAIRNSKRLLSLANDSIGREYHEDPSTRIHVVVERLIEIADGRRQLRLLHETSPKFRTLLIHSIVSRTFCNSFNQFYRRSETHICLKVLLRYWILH